jgi:hypothetical protein
MRIARDVLLDCVIDTGKRPLGDTGAESLGTLLDEGLELRDVSPGSNDAPHRCFDLISAMKAVISA